jgi:hypothetical protein
MGTERHIELDLAERLLGVFASFSLPIFILILIDLRVDLGLFIS